MREDLAVVTVPIHLLVRSGEACDDLQNHILELGYSQWALYKRSVIYPSAAEFNHMHYCRNYHSRHLFLTN
jgi:hypothetical protein